jgi:hypothetical protein
MANCAICGRTLTSKKSIAAGVGPVCGQNGGKGKRHKGKSTPILSSGNYNNGTSNGHRVEPPSVPDIDPDEALAIIEQVAAGG